MNPICLDYETFYIAPKAGHNDPVSESYSVAQLGNWRYCNDPRFDAYMLSVYDGTESWVGSPKDFNWNALQGKTLIAHNAGFDSAVTRRLVELEKIPKHVLNNPWICTANMTSFLCSCRSLAEAVHVLEKRRLDKGMRDYMNGKQWADVAGSNEGIKLADYAREDAIECWNLYAKYGSQWPQFERDLSALTILQSARGVAIDIPLLRRYREILPIVIFTLVQSLPWTEGGSKPSSPLAIAKHCRLNGIPCPPTKTEDDAGFDLWEATYREKHPWVLGAGMWRSLNKLATTLKTIETRLRPDGTIDFSLLYFGGQVTQPKLRGFTGKSK